MKFFIVAAMATSVSAFGGEMAASNLATPMSEKRAPEKFDRKKREKSSGSSTSANAEPASFRSTGKPYGGESTSQRSQPSVYGGGMFDDWCDYNKDCPYPQICSYGYCTRPAPVPQPSPIFCPSSATYAPGAYCLAGDIHWCTRGNEQNPMVFKDCGGNGCKSNAPGTPDQCYGNNGGNGGGNNGGNGGGNAGATGCDNKRDCSSCMRSNNCNWDPNWGKCRPNNECDFEYKPRAAAYSAAEDTVNMNTACYSMRSQCYNGDTGGGIDENNNADSCTRATSCRDCVNQSNNGVRCVFDVSGNYCKTPTGFYPFAFDCPYQGACYYSDNQCYYN